MFRVISIDLQIKCLTLLYYITSTMPILSGIVVLPIHRQPVHTHTYTCCLSFEVAPPARGADFDRYDDILKRACIVYQWEIRRD